MPPPPPPPPAFDAATFDTILREVDDAALRIRAALEAEQRSYLRADGLFLVVTVAFLFTIGGGLFGYDGPGWWLPAAILVIAGLCIFLLPSGRTRWTAPLARRYFRRWGLPPLEVGAGRPDLGRSVRVVDGMRKDWQRLEQMVTMTTLCLLVAVLGCSTVLSSVITGIVQPGTLLAIRYIIVASTIVVVAPGVAAVVRWARVHRAQIRALGAVAYEADLRFHQMESAFWQRF